MYINDHLAALKVKAGDDPKRKADNNNGSSRNAALHGTGHYTRRTGGASNKDTTLSSALQTLAGASPSHTPPRQQKGASTTPPKQKGGKVEAHNPNHYPIHDPHRNPNRQRQGTTLQQREPCPLLVLNLLKKKKKNPSKTHDTRQPHKRRQATKDQCHRWRLKVQERPRSCQGLPSCMRECKGCTPGGSLLSRSS